jgi:hypothetical protein
MSLDEIRQWLGKGSYNVQAAPDQIRLDGGADKMVVLIREDGEYRVVKAEVWEKANTVTLV